jgi:hypothetical protein
VFLSIASLSLGFTGCVGRSFEELRLLPEKMNYLKSISTAIPDVILPTIETYQSLLSANKDAILSTLRATHSYGSHPRQMLYVYSPTSAATE